MRTFFTLLYSIVALLAQAQKPQTVMEATITTETEFLYKEENLEEADNMPFINSSLLYMLGRGSDGRITLKTTTYLKDNMAATMVKNNGSITTHVRNFTTGLTYSFTEYEAYRPPGAITVTYFTDTQVMEELNQMNKDLAAKQKDTLAAPNVKVYYQDITKNIAGYPCKQAIVYLLYSNGLTGKITVWYNEAIKLNHIASTGDPNYLTMHKYIGIPNNQFNLLSAVDGFPMAYEMKLYKDVYISVTVTELNISKRVRDKFFRLPYDHRLNAYKKGLVKFYDEPPEFKPIVSDPSKEDN